jgi:hypothetical protein
MLYLITGAAKRPSLITFRNKEEYEFYISFLHSFLISDSKNYRPSEDEWKCQIFGNDNPNVDWLLGKAKMSKAMFDTEQNRRRQHW